jgi:serine/threonine protein kinase/WD40 repeat protein
MASRANSCDTNRLRLSLDEQLSESEQAELEEHLESCPGCRQELEKLAAASHFWGDAQLLRGAAVRMRRGSLAHGVNAEVTHGLDGGDDDGELDGGWLEFLEAPGPDQPDALGKLGPYEVIEFLGRGGMGLVLKARDPALDRMVAIKVLTPALAHGATARRRFAREAKAVAAVGHEHIVAIHAVDEFRGLPYLVMQYVPGRSLQDRLDAAGPLEVKEILRIGTQAARALAAAHAQGVVHRDIKPANILLENCIERVKLTDFGLARAIDDASLTQSGVIAGTPQYMAPEQARGEPVAATADLFSLGAVLYAMAAGRPPFRADSALAVLKRVCEIPHRSVREHNPDVPDWLEAVIDRLLAKEPALRFQTATEVADLLERGLAHVQQPATVPPPVVSAVNPRSTQLLDIDLAATKPLPRPRRRFPLVAAILLLIGASFGATEAAGLTQVSEFVATILRIKTPEGTLVIKCGDPSVKVQLDGRDVVIAGSGLQEIRLRTGTHRLAVLKDGKPVREDLVSVARGGKEIVNVALEATGSAPGTEEKISRDMLAPPSHADQCLTCHTSLHIMRDDQPLPSGHPPLDLAFFVHAGRDPVQVHRNVSANVLLDIYASVKPQPARSRGLVWSLAFTPDGRQLVVGQQGIGGGASTVRLWDLAKGREIALFQHPESAGYRCLAFSPDGRNLAVGNFDGSLAVVRTNGWVPHYEANNGSPINAVAFLPKSAVVAAGGWDGQVKFFHPTAKIDSQMEYPGRIYAIAISPDGSTLAVGGEGKMIQLYDIDTFRKKATFHGHTHAVESLDFSPDGKLLASAGGFTVRVWDVAGGIAAAPHIQHSPEVLCVRFSPDGKLLAISDGDTSVTRDKVLETAIVLFAVPDWKIVRELRGHKNNIRALAFSPDGQTIASGSMDQTVKIWDVKTGKLEQSIVPGDSDPNGAKPASGVSASEPLKN